MRAASPSIIDWSGLDALIAELKRRDYRVIGPTARDGAILLEEVTSAADLPLGVGDQQEAGTYRLRKRDDHAAFGYTVGPQSWRRFLSPPRELIWRATRSANGFSIVEGEDRPDRRYAFIGVRACDLRAVEIQERVFDRGTFSDDRFASRRHNALIVAVNCTEPGSTCFCSSTGTGPRCGAGFDLALTELTSGCHRFLVEVGSADGAEILASISSKPASDEEVELGGRLVDSASRSMGRNLDVDGLRDLLSRNLQNSRWDSVAERCLGCSNCTLVCPTCFCSTVEDTTDLGGEAERWRRWDSCFTAEFSYIHGGTVRSTIKARYRQWLTHKLGTWNDQFGSSGCVGCGRCITWCPVGIDLTEEIAAIRRSEQTPDERSTP